MIGMYVGSNPTVPTHFKKRNIMTMLREILDMIPLPVKWISSTQAIFLMDNVKYGILLDVQTLTLPSRNIDICNIVFGVLIDPNKSVTEDNLDRSLTNKNRPRTVLSTVAKACEKSTIVLDTDVVILAGADQQNEKRANIYLVGVTELGNILKSFKHTFRFKMGKNAQIVAISKILFSDEEVKFMSEHLTIQK